MIGNHVCGYPVPRVQIPVSPPLNQKTRSIIESMEI